ncbi:MAG: HD domain-containing protein [Pseudomonadota bacterium]
MNRDDVAARLAFLREAERLKDTLRSGITAQGRTESTAEHTWRVALFALAFADHLQDINLERLLALIVVHDLGEVYAGDVPAIYQFADDGREARERVDFHTLTDGLPVDVRSNLRSLFDEYAAGETPEAKLAKGFDKLETMLQHTQGANAPDFDYDFNLDYARRWTQADKRTSAIRDLIDEATTRRSRGQAAWPDDAD